MTLEDFFTLSEMKDGLTALSRVEELVTVMQKEKDCAVKNVSDASRQWTAVASTIAATENKDCLDLFIQLEGLLFIDKWLKDAQKFCTDREESSLEESIITLLRALEKLHINNEKSVSSGIWVTVKDLCEHKSSTVQDRARILFDCWEQGKDDGAVNCEVEETVKKIEVSVDDRSSKLASGETSEDPTSMTEPCGELISPNVSSDLQPERGDEVKIDEENNRISTPRRVDSAELNERADLASSIVSSSNQENPCPMDYSSPSTLGETPAGTSFTTPKSDTAVEKRDLPIEGRFSELDMQEDKLEDSVSSPPESKVAPSDIDAEDSHDLTRQPMPQNKSEASKNDENKKESGADCAMTSASDSKDATAEDGECCSEAIPGPSLNSNVVGEGADLDKASRLKDLGTNDEDKGGDGDDSSDDEDLDFRSAYKLSKPVMDSKQSLQGSSLNGSRVAEDEDLDMASKLKDLGTYDEDKDDDDSSDEEDLDFRNAYKFSKPVMDTKRSDTIHKRRSDVELDYGVDPLEVARQVAKAVEREVGDPKGTFCSSSSEKTSDEQPGSPDSINEEQEQPSSKTPTKEVTTTPQVLPAEEERNVDNEDRAKQDDCNHDPDSSQVTKAAQETAATQERGFCDFDLNDEVCPDEMENLVNPPVSATISVSASRPTTAPGFPAAPLQFEGTLGWKGSARTSAFRPASPRKNSDADKNASVAGTSDGSSKQRQDWLDFDLNVADDDLGKQIPTLFSGRRNNPSGESSVEASPKRSERFNLDLNSTDDGSGGDVLLPSSSRLEARQIFNRNGLRSPSPSSSSSSMRNFDLNDRPSFNFNDPPPLQDHFKPSLLTVNAFPAPKQDNSSSISIMGTRVEINKRDTAAVIPQSLFSSLSNGKAIVEPGIESSSAGMMTGTGSFLGLAPAGLYTHSQPVFGYNGLTGGPAMYAPGGPIHLMDSRAATMMMPQLVPSASLSSVPTYPHQPPFMMSMASSNQHNPHPSLNGAGPSRPNFDLNSGFMIDGGANNREMGLRQFFLPGPPVNSQLPAPAGSSSSGGGGKRKEPDSGWEGFQFSYKHHQQQPPWR